MLRHRALRWRALAGGALLLLPLLPLLQRLHLVEVFV